VGGFVGLAESAVSVTEGSVSLKPNFVHARCFRDAGRADEAVCLHTPASFSAVGSYYLRFEQTSDEEVRRLLPE